MATGYRFVSRGIPWGLLLTLLAFGVPRAEVVFNDFGIPLPQTTIWAIRASHAVVAIAVLTLLLFVVDGFAWDAFSRRGDLEGRRCWSALMIAVPLVLIALTLAAVSFPLFFTCFMRLDG